MATVSEGAAIPQDPPSPSAAGQPSASPQSPQHAQDPSNGAVGPTANQPSTFVPPEQTIPIPFERMEVLFPAREQNRLYFHRATNALCQVIADEDSHRADIRYLMQPVLTKLHDDIEAALQGSQLRPLSGAQLDNLLNTLILIGNGNQIPPQPQISWLLVPLLLFGRDKRTVADDAGPQFGIQCLSCIRKILGGDLLFQACIDLMDDLIDNFCSDVSGCLDRIVYPAQRNRLPRTGEGLRISYIPPAVQEAYMTMFSNFCYVALSYVEAKLEDPEVDVRSWSLQDLAIILDRAGRIPSLFGYVEISLTRFTPTVIRGGLGCLDDYVTHFAQGQAHVNIEADNRFEEKWIYSSNIWDAKDNWYLLQRDNAVINQYPLCSGWLNSNPRQNFDVNARWNYDDNGFVVRLPTIASQLNNNEVVMQQHPPLPGEGARDFLRIYNDSVIAGGTPTGLYVGEDPSNASNNAAQNSGASAPVPPPGPSLQPSTQQQAATTDTVPPNPAGPETANATTQAQPPNTSGQSPTQPPLQTPQTSSADPPNVQHHATNANNLDQQSNSANHATGQPHAQTAHIPPVAPPNMYASAPMPEHPP